MLPKEKRINRELFEIIFKKGERRENIFFRAVFLSSEKQRFSIVLSKKVENKATKRNTIKRKISSLLEEKIKNKEAVGVNIIFFVKKLGNKKEYKEWFEKIWREIMFVDRDK
jgi:ribonuclease P protein component